MSKKKWVLPCVLAFAMLSAAMLISCTAKEEEKEVAKVTTSDGRAMEGNLYLEGIPLVKETESFSFLVDDTTDPGRIPNLEMIKLIRENTNVEVEWMVFPHEVAVERENLLINTGDYPDVIGGWLVNRDEVVKYGTGEGIYIPLEDLFAQYAPNVMECLAVPGVRTNMTLPDGHIYSPPYPVPEPEMIFSPWINQVWLDNLGLEMPTTVDEFYDVLVAFKEQDANGNGDPNDEIPIGSQPQRIANWFAFFGLGTRNEGTDIVIVDGEVIFTPIQESYKEAIKFFNKLYAEQLLDTEIFTADHDSFFANGKGVDATYGAAILYSPNDISPGLDPETRLNVRATDYVPLPPLDNGTGIEPLWGRGSTGTTTFASQLIITDVAENPATIVRWIDYLYDREISLQIGHGRFDVTLRENDDGTYEYMEKTDITGAPLYVQWLNPIPRFVRPEDDAKVIKDAATLQNEANLDAMDAVWADNMTTQIPILWSTEEESKDIAIIDVDLRNHIVLKRADWITGTADIDEEWDEYIEDLNNMGLETFMEIRTNQINAALGN